MNLEEKVAGLAGLKAGGMIARVQVGRGLTNLLELKSFVLKEVNKGSWGNAKGRQVINIFRWHLTLQQTRFWGSD